MRKKVCGKNFGEGKLVYDFVIRQIFCCFDFIVIFNGVYVRCDSQISLRIVFIEIVEFLYVLRMIVKASRVLLAFLRIIYLIDIERDKI